MENAIIKMKKYGMVLTGREYGKDVMDQLRKEFPSQVVTLDFHGVVSLGSSFADEVLVPIAQMQNNEIETINSNKPVYECLIGVAKENKIILRGQGVSGGTSRT